jgi:hypothetical protein
MVCSKPEVARFFPRRGVAMAVYPMQRVGGGFAQKLPSCVVGRRVTQIIKAKEFG